MSIIISDEKLVRQIEELAQQERREPEEIVAEALRAYEARSQETRLSSFWHAVTGLGRSEQPDIAERDEEILATEIDPIRGWSSASDQRERPD